jgi:MEDS: MEthanogen/methylotroph, DcmR Sensory domain
LLWHTASDFTDSLVPFIDDGLEAREPVMVAVVPEHLAWLQEALAHRAEYVEFVDMHELGHNPARIIPAWQHFLDSKANQRSPIRGIGEPIWPRRRSQELLECQFHEALLNVAIDPEIPFWLICPYDAAALSPDVLDEAHRSHPVILDSNLYYGSSRYEGRAHVESIFTAELPELKFQPAVAVFTPNNVTRVAAYVKLEFHVGGLGARKASDLAEVIQRLASSSLHRGATVGTVRIFRQPDDLICEVVDDTVIVDPLIGRHAPTDGEDDSLWIANQMCDLVQVRSSSAGTTVRVHAWR